MTKLAVNHNGKWDKDPTLLFMDGKYSYVLDMAGGCIMETTRNFQLFQSKVKWSGSSPEQSEWKLIQDFN